MKKQLAVFLLSIYSSVLLFGQWEEHNIISYEINATLSVWFDMNNDGLDDFLGYDETLESLFIRENDGSGLSNPTVILEDILIDDDIMTTVDWNKDGNVDVVFQIATLDFENIHCLLLINNGDGSFTDSEFSFEPTVPNSEMHLFGDFNNDGFQDLILKRDSRHYLQLSNNGVIESSGAQLNSFTFLGTAFYVADMNNDGFDDLLEADGDFQINVLEWDGNGMSITKTIGSQISTDNQNGAFHTGLRIKDFDFDGDLDFVRGISRWTSVNTGDLVEFFDQGTDFYSHVQDENGDFSRQLVQIISPNIEENFRYTLVQNKENQSTKLVTFHDVIREFELDNDLWVESNSFDKPSFIPSLFVPNAHNILDSNKENLTLGNFTIAVESSNPTQGYDWIECYGCGSTFINFYEDLDLADLDGDGDLDILVVGRANSHELLWLENELAGCEFNTLRPLVEKFDHENVIGINAETADFENDGDTDIIIKVDARFCEETTLCYDSFLYLMKNDGTSNFSEPTLLYQIPYGKTMFVRDLNNDQFPEIIINTAEGGSFPDPETFSITILQNTTGIENCTEQRISTDYSNAVLMIDDMDNDEDLDFVIYNSVAFPHNITTYTNDNSNFAISQFYEGFNILRSPNLFDFDQNNFPSFIATEIDTITDERIFYRYPNQAGIIDYDNRIELFESISFSDYHGVHNEDSSYGFVAQRGSGTKESLLYADETGQTDTLYFGGINLFILDDINNDGFDDILCGNGDGTLNFYTLGEIECSEECIPNTQGYLYSKDCDGQELFVIETTDGILMNPFFPSDFAANIKDSIFLNFSYTEVGFSNPCDGAITAQVDCVEEVLPWLPSVIAEAEACCDINKIESFTNGSVEFIYTSPSEDCENSSERLYSQDGELICTEPIDFAGECIGNYNLNEFERTTIWECEGTVANDDLIDNKEILVYPNPSAGLFNIKSDLQGQLKVYDTHGKCVQFYNNIPSSINLINLTEGMYILSFSHQNEVITKRIVKM